MNKTELVREMAKAGQMTQKDACKALEAFERVMEKALANKDDVRLQGFGTFCAVEREARTGINPQTGEPMDIAARVAIKFKPSSVLKAAVNEE